MKKIFVLSALIFSSVCFAQTEQGSKFIGGGIGYSSSGGENKVGTTSTDKPTTSAFTFTPQFGYLIATDLAVGAQLNVNLMKVKDGDDKTTSNTFGLSVFAKKYQQIVDRVYIFGQANIGFSSGKTKFDNGGTEVDGPTTNTFGINIFPGVEFFATPQISVFTSVGLLGLNFTNEKDDTGPVETNDKTTNFDLNLNLSNLNFGFFYYF